MRHFTIAMVVLACLFSCISAPEYKRDNTLDKSAGIPYILSLTYYVRHNGVLLNWVDGSIQNDMILIEQRIYDHTETTSDSLIKITELEGDAIHFLDDSMELGYPYQIIVTSVIQSNSGKDALYSDTLDIEFSKLTYRSKYTSSEYFIANWQNQPNVYVGDSIMVEAHINGDWEFFDFIPPRAQSFQYPLSQIENVSRFRVSATVMNFNGVLSRTSSFEVEPE